MSTRRVLGTRRPSGVEQPGRQIYLIVKDQTEIACL